MSDFKSSLKQNLPNIKIDNTEEALFPNTIFSIGKIAGSFIKG